MTFEGITDEQLRILIADLENQPDQITPNPSVKERVKKEKLALYKQELERRMKEQS